jgi:putative oxidoreductase
VPPRKNNDYAPYVALALRLLLGAFFVYSGWAKIWKEGLDNFTRAVANYKIVHEPLDAVVAYTIPWVEITCGLLLITGLWLRGALLTLAGLVAVFAFGVGMAGAKNLNIACGCTGNPDGSPMNYTMKFLEFGLYWLAFFFIWFLGRRGSGHVFGGTRLKLPG